MRRINHMLIAVAVAALGSTSALAHHPHHSMAMHGHNSEMGHHQTASARLANNPALVAQLNSRLGPLLPTGTNIQTAAAGFKSLGQFVAAVHVAHNLNISFADLKAKMTGPNAESLGKAIEDLKPSLSAATVKQDVKLAKHEAKQDLEESTETADKDDQATAVAQKH